jgi:aspartate kinase
MEVFKFGGASIASVERIQGVANIIRDSRHSGLLVVISAMGKTTNGLEKVVEAFYEGRQQQAFDLFKIIKEQHLTTAKYLLIKEYNVLELQLRAFFTEVEWLLHDRVVQSFDYYYDQVVCVGELMSSAIVSAYLSESGVPNAWIDVRDVLRTDNNFRDAGIDFQVSAQQVQANVTPLLKDGGIVVTQGFIGATSDNESTTLGREGSDYTAALFASLLKGTGVTIWKDVASVMNADPRLFPDAVPVPALNYEEVIEMAYYGAQVIHPKTIKPLQNSNIPLFVKCFLDATLPGTVIDNRKVKDLPPIIVRKNDQALIRLHTHDYGFIGEEPMSELYNMLGELKIKPNLIQTGAVSLMLVIDDRPEKISALASAAATYFDVQVAKGFTLLTVRHYTEPVLEKLLNEKTIELMQKTRQTMQCIYA